MIAVLILLLLAALVVGLIVLASFLRAREARWEREARRPRDAFRGGGFGNGAGRSGFGRGGFGRAGPGSVPPGRRDRAA